MPTKQKEKCTRIKLSLFLIAGFKNFNLKFGLNLGEAFFGLCMFH